MASIQLPSWADIADEAWEMEQQEKAKAEDTKSQLAKQGVYVLYDDDDSEKPNNNAKPPKPLDEVWLGDRALRGVDACARFVDLNDLYSNEQRRFRWLCREDPDLWCYLCYGSESRRPVKTHDAAKRMLATRYGLRV